MRNFANPTDTRTLEEIAAEMNSNPRAHQYVTRIGLEVEGLRHRAGERHTLAPIYDPIGFAPRPGDHIECSALGGGEWVVTAVATGEPGSMRVQR